MFHEGAYVDEKNDTLPPKPEGDLTSKQVDKGFEWAHGHDKRKFVYAETPRQLAQGLERQEQPITSDDINEAILAEERETGEVYPKFKPEDDPLKDQTIDPKSKEAEAVENIAEIETTMTSAINKAYEAVQKGDLQEAARIGRDLTGDMDNAVRNALPPEIRKDTSKLKGWFEEVMADPRKKSLYKLACGACDFIPIAGPAKMCCEAMAGKTLGGNELKGWRRFLHGTEGVVFLAIDCTGVGILETKGLKLVKAGGKGTLVGGRAAAKSAPRLMTRSAALLRKLGVSRKVYGPVFKGGRFLIKHPKLAQLADKGYRNIIKQRTERKATMEIGKAISDKTATAEQEAASNTVANINERPGMELPADETFEYDANHAKDVAA